MFKKLVSMSTALLMAASSFAAALPTVTAAGGGSATSEVPFCLGYNIVGDIYAKNGDVYSMKISDTTITDNGDGYWWLSTELDYDMIKSNLDAYGITRDDVEVFGFGIDFSSADASVSPYATVAVDHRWSYDLDFVGLDPEKFNGHGESKNVIHTDYVLSDEPDTTAFTIDPSRLGWSNDIAHLTITYKMDVTTTALVDNPVDDSVDVPTGPADSSYPDDSRAPDTGDTSKTPGGSSSRPDGSGNGRDTYHPYWESTGVHNGEETSSLPGSNVDPEQNAVARKLTYTPSVSVYFNDGTSKTVKDTLATTKTDDLVRFDTTIAMEDLTAVIESAGKTLADFDYLGFDITTSCPEGVDINDDYVVDYLATGRTFDEFSDGDPGYSEDGIHRYGFIYGIIQGVNEKNTVYKWTPDHHFGQTDTVIEDLIYIDISYAVDLTRASVYNGDTSSKPEDPSSKPEPAGDLTIEDIDFCMTIAIAFSDGTTYRPDIPVQRLPLSDDNVYTFHNVTINAAAIDREIAAAGKTPADLDCIYFYIEANTADGGELDKALYAEFTYDWSFSSIYANGDKLNMGMNASKTVQAVNSKSWFYGWKPISDNDYSGLESLDVTLNIDLNGAKVFDPDAPKVVAGDIDGDDKVNISDLTTLAAAVKGIKPLTAEQQARADLNHDGKVNINDLTILTAHIKGIQTLN